MLPTKEGFSPATGLSNEEVVKQRLTFGWNLLEEKKKISAFSIFFRQLTSFLILLLLFASAISFLVGDVFDGIVILFTVLLNAILGFYQEYKAEKAIRALKSLVSSKVTVVREGREFEIDSKELVPKDVVILAEGDKIPADGKLIEAFHLEVNESSLTGESMHVLKEVGEEERDGVYMGTVVVKGRGKIEVVATGAHTKFGQIAETLVMMEEGETPLQRQLGRLGRELVVGTLLICFIIFVIGIMSGQGKILMFLTSVSLAVAAVPEGLPAVVTIILAIGVQRMVKKRAIVRKLSAIETLGATSVICSDKTGTMTKNEMIVRKVWVDGGFSDITANLAFSPTFSKLLKIGVLCNSAKLVYRIDGGTYDILGDPTEGALLLLADELHFNSNAIREEGKLVDEFPFDADKKLMSVLWQIGNTTSVLTKGSPEAVISLCSSMFVNGEVVPIDEQMRNDLLGVFAEAAKKRLRLLGFAYKDTGLLNDGYKREEVENGLTFVGFVGMEDAPRHGVREAVERAERAGIRVVMLTGDHQFTAVSIAQEIGLVDHDGADVIVGKQLDDISDSELDSIVERVKIFARIAPHHKLRIVQAFQRKGFVVAATGDGVNDALALKQADVGVAMGITGTDVAKEASDMVVVDDNFTTIVEAVTEGRVIYRNILKVITYLLSGNVGEILVIFLAIVAGLPSPLAPIQILWVNLITDSFPALALASDSHPGDIMKRKPREKDKDILDEGNLAYILIVGALVGVITLISYIVTFSNFGEKTAQMVALNVIILLHLINAFIVRRSRYVFANKALLAVVVLTILLQIAISTIEPLRVIFRFS